MDSLMLKFLQYFDTVGWVFWPVKTVAHITYIVLVETLNHAQSISSLSLGLCGGWIQVEYCEQRDLWTRTVWHSRQHS